MSVDSSNEITVWEHQKSILAKRVTDVGSDQQTLVDESGAPATTYVGLGARGLSQATSGWLLTKITVSGTTTTVQHAINSWDNRASASYS